MISNFKLMVLLQLLGNHTFSDRYIIIYDNKIFSFVKSECKIITQYQGFEGKGI